MHQPASRAWLAADPTAVAPPETMEASRLRSTDRSGRAAGTHSLDQAPLLLLPCYVLALVIAFIVLPPLPQDPAYHRFAEDRHWLGIPNFPDVASNLAILLPAVAGLILVNRCGPVRGMFRTSFERALATTCFAALVLTAIGSTWYHLAPDNTRLFWDRLPLGLAFTTLPALLIAERFSLSRWSRLMILLWVLSGPAAVVWWHLGELVGRGDLRPYFMLHAFLFLLPPALVALHRPYTRSALYAVAYVLFVLAMAGDRLDQAIFDLTHGFVSGHTMKHLLTGLAIGTLACMLAIRRQRRETPSPSVRY